MYSFQQIDDNDISYVENYIKTKLYDDAVKKISNKYDIDCEAVLDEAQLTDLFGSTFASQPAEFQFHLGDKKLIKLLAERVKNDENTTQHKNDTNFRSKVVVQQKKVEENKKSSAANRAVKTEGIDLSDNALIIYEGKLFQKVFAYIEKYESLDEPPLIFKSMVNVCVKGNSIKGEVVCVLCGQMGKVCKRKVFFKAKQKGRGFWVVSNFVNHLKSQHKLVADDISDVDNSMSEAESVIDDNIDKLRNLPIIQNHTNDGQLNKQNDIMDKLGSSPIAGNHTNDEQDDIFNKLENSPIVEKGTKDAQSNAQADSKAANVLHEQISNQISSVLSSVLVHGQQQTDMQFFLNDRKATVKVTKIIGDGNCLFSAIAHQLYYLNVNSLEHENAHKKLRYDVVAHIRSNFSSFEHQIKDRIFELKDMHEIDDINKECQFFLQFCLARDRYWGGAETIKAVCEICKVNIVVYNESGPCTLYANGNELYDRTIIIAYRLATSSQKFLTVRNHYDSVCDIGPLVQYESIQLISSNFEKKIAFSEVKAVDETIK